MPASLDFTHPNPTNWQERGHNDAVISPSGVERALIGLCNDLAEYCQSYAR